MHPLPIKNYLLPAGHDLEKDVIVEQLVAFIFGKFIFNLD